MAQKNATLRGRIGETLYDLMPKGSVYNTYVDDTVTLADKLQEMVTALNGKVTPEQLEEAMLDAGIIKRSLLPEGYPYSALIEIFPEQTIDFPADMDYQAPFMQPIGLVGGENYEVSWRGTVYPCTAESADMDGTPVVVMGDLGAMAGEPTGSHPFIIVEFPPESAAANGGIYGAIMSLDGSESASFSIRFFGNIPIDKKWLPEGYPYILEGGTTVLEEGALTPSEYGTGYFECPVELTPHMNYTITWNGTDYSAESRSITGTDGTAYYWGNPLILGLESTSEPFVIVCNNTGMWFVIAYDESTEATMKIVSQKSYVPMDKRYMPDGGNMNIVNGEAAGSLRGVSAAKEVDGYKLGHNSMALGYHAKASGDSSMAFGEKAVASEIEAIAIGNNVQATGWGSFAFGYGSTSSGRLSVATGLQTIASGKYSHAEGANTTASENSAHAEGGGTVASGGWSHAEGLGTIASYDNQHVQGKYNVEGNYAHIVGNGHYYTATKETVRSNAHTLDWSGNAWFAGSVEGTALILTSPGGKRFSVTVDDSGSLTAAELAT